MLDLTALLFDEDHYGNTLRYDSAAKGEKRGTKTGMGPVVVWNSTALCNLRCVHCYYGAEYTASEAPTAAPGGASAKGLPTGQALAFVDSLAVFRVPVLLLSGGEPLLRPDLLDIIGRAVCHGLRVTLSTNGTLITRERAAALKKEGVSYVGVSLDGMEEVNDRFRGRPGAFKAALEGIRNCRAAGQRVGLRMTLSRYNFRELDRILDLVEHEDIPRVCFYHLVHAGRGRAQTGADLTHDQTRHALDLIIARTRDFVRRGLRKEILTVDNHADGVYLYRKLLADDPARAARVLERLRASGGNRSGMAIAAVSHLGDVFPDQFSGTHRLGNVTEKPFPEIWGGDEQPLLRDLRNRGPLLKGRCARCAWLDVCNGNLRARAEAATGDFWASDPACYLTDGEIGEGVA